MMEYGGVHEEIDRLTEAGELKHLYEEMPEGGWRLNAIAREAMSELINAATELEAQHETQKQRLAKLEKDVEAISVRYAVRMCLIRAKVRPEKHEACIKAITAAHSFVVTEGGSGEVDDYTVVTVTPWGAISLDHSVAYWLSSPEAAEYQPAKPTHPLGPISRMIRSMH